jgi:hypothetical protein
MPKVLVATKYQQLAKKQAAIAKRKANIERMIKINAIFQSALIKNNIAFVTEYQFDKYNLNNLEITELGKLVKKPRKWRADYFFPQANLVLEIEGGIFTGGRHTRAIGFLKDMEKYNALTMQGIKLLRCTPNQLNNLATLTNIKILCKTI